MERGKERELSYERIDIKRRLKTYVRRIEQFQTDIDKIIGLLLEGENEEMAKAFAILALTLENAQNLLEKLADAL